MGVAVAVALAPLTGAAGQVPDSVPVELPGLRIVVGQVAEDVGGAARLVVPLDSVAPVVAGTAEDLLRATPLIRIRRNARGQAAPFLRGGDDRQVAVLLDGVPLTLGYDHRADLSALPLSAARSLTLTRGPAPLSLGPNVTLGAVEIDLAGAVRGALAPGGPRLAVEGSDPAGFRMEAQAARSVALGSRRLDVAAGGALIDRRGLAVASEVPASPWLSGGDGLRLASDLWRQSGFVTARIDGGGAAWISVTGLAHDGRRGVEPETHVDEPRFWRYPDDGGRLLLASAGTPRVGTALGEVDATVHAGVRTSELTLEEYAWATYDRVEATERWDDRTSTLRGVVNVRPSPALALQVSGTASSTRHLEWVGERAPERTRQRLWSGAAELTWTRGRLEIDVGGGIDAADTPASADKPALERQEGWAGRLGVAWSARPGLRVHAAAARRVRFPSLRELYAGPLSRFEPNPGLKPERLAAVEGGFTMTRGAGTLQVVGFHRDLADGIVRVTLPGGRPPRFQRQNLDLVRSTGLEVVGDAVLGGIELRGDATLQRVRGSQEGDARDVDYAPAFAGSLAVGRMLALGVRGEAGVRWESVQSCRSPGSAEGDEFSNDPAVDLELRREFRPSGAGLPRHLEAIVRVGNLTDAAFYDQCGLPRRGRTLSFGVRVR